MSILSATALLVGVVDMTNAPVLARLSLRQNTRSIKIAARARMVMKPETGQTP